MKPSRTKFETIEPDYKKRVLRVLLDNASGPVSLPFAFVPGIEIKTSNRIVSIEKSKGGSTILLKVRDGRTARITTSWVMHCLRNEEELRKLAGIKRILKKSLSESRFSVRQVARVLETSPNQIYELIGSGKINNHAVQLMKLSALLGYKLELREVTVD